MKNIPQRSCVACRTPKSKNDLLRIVINKNNGIKIDENGKEEGRGAYICYNENCLEKAMKLKKLQISDEMEAKIKNIIKNKNGGDVIG